MRAHAVLALAFVALACSSTDESSSSDLSGPVSFTETTDYVDFTNGAGTYRIYKDCLGPDSTLPGYIGHDGTVGPGYIATVWTGDSRVALDDTVVPAHLGLNSGATGLGQFGFHLARGYAPNYTTSGTNAFQVTTRFCNANRRPSGYAGYNGFGVRSFSSKGNGYYTAPHVDTSGHGHFAIESVLGDEFSDLVSVRYTYVFTPSTVKAWVRVTTLCDHGTCDATAAGGNAFLKEPKLVAGINPTTQDSIHYRRMTTFDLGGKIAGSATHDNHWTNSCSTSASFPARDGACEWGGQNPVQKTGQCDDAARTRVRFWDGSSCPKDVGCLVVAAESATTELAAGKPWEGSGYGLDAWAVRNVTANRERANAKDSSGGGATWSCNGASDTQSNRRWEIAGYALTSSCNYTTAVASFHGWEGGTGMFDCEPDYYRFGPAGESYVNALSFGFETADLP
jgi:hypothetical protein